MSFQLKSDTSQLVSQSISLTGVCLRVRMGYKECIKNKLSVVSLAVVQILHLQTFGLVDYVIKWIFLPPSLPNRKMSHSWQCFFKASLSSTFAA